METTVLSKMEEDPEQLHTEDCFEKYREYYYKGREDYEYIVALLCDDDPESNPRFNECYRSWMKNSSSSSSKEEKILLYKVNVTGMYRHGWSGRLVTNRGAFNRWRFFKARHPSSWRDDDQDHPIPIALGNSTNLPISMSTFLLPWIVENDSSSVEEAVIKDITDFTKHTCSCSAATIIVVQVDLRIVTAQRKGEDIVSTRERSIRSNTSPSVRRLISVYTKEQHLPSLYPKEKLHYDQKQAADECCTICLQELNCSPTGYLPCSHVFHCDCIAKWFWRSNRCPLCCAPYRRNLVTGKDW